MKATINDHAGHLRVQVQPESNEERQLLRAFLREHATHGAFLEFVEDQSNALFVTFGLKPRGG